MVSFSTKRQIFTVRFFLLVPSVDFFFPEANEKTSHHFGKGKFTTPPKNHCRKSSQVRAVFSETEDFFQPKVQGPLAVMKIQKTPTICTVVKRKSFQQIPIPFKIKFVSPPRSPLKNCLLTKNWQAKTSRECP